MHGEYAAPQNREHAHVQPRSHPTACPRHPVPAGGGRVRVARGGPRQHRRHGCAGRGLGRVVAVCGALSSSAYGGKHAAAQTGAAAGEPMLVAESDVAFTPDTIEVLLRDSDGLRAGERPGYCGVAYLRQEPDGTVVGDRHPDGARQSDFAEFSCRWRRRSGRSGGSCARTSCDASRWTRQRTRDRCARAAPGFASRGITRCGS